LQKIFQTEDAATALKGQKFVLQVLSLKDVEADKNQEGKSEKDRMKAVKFK
jgi:flagellar biosynthesis regulator FlbT